ncbi:hypothetical protein ACFPRA_01470 [Sporosarcina soli]|uniref:Uncharacterized protein n=1 Tax=Sporosarcina soli TaxID=334736 RepID=A0ABW0TE20_9BACL
MTEKVKIPQSVADAYTDLETRWTLTDIFKMVTADFTVSDSHVQTLVEWNESGREDEGAGLMQLLLGQYEVEPEYKVEDWVIYKGFEGDVTVKIVAIQYEHARVQFEGVSNWKEIADVERHATPEEIKVEKERRWWAKHGRDVWELKQGDVLMATRRTIYEVTADPKSHRFDCYTGNGECDFDIEECKRDNWKVICFHENRKDVRHA